MGYLLANHVSYCTIGDKAIFLDLREDRYFCLGESAEAAFDGLIRGVTASTRITSDLERLEAAHIIRLHAGETRISPVVAQPAQSEIDTVDAQAGNVEILAALYHIGRTELFLRSHSLLDAIARFKTRKACVRQTRMMPSQVGTIAHANSRLKRIMRSTDRCLQRSLALADHLTAHHIPVSLVFGVTLAPFSAHCWVQYGTIVLNDHVDYVAQRTPILIL